MKLIVGLGNPGNKYLLNRHNVGFIFVDTVAREFNVEPKSSFKGLLARDRDLVLQKQEFMLLKPQTFMNLSGESVALVCQFYKISPKDVIVVYDDLDLAFGVVRRKDGGGHGGHKGVSSMIEKLGSDFYRIKIGIGRPSEDSLNKSISDWVLSDFNAKELEALQSSLLSETYEKILEITKEN